LSLFRGELTGRAGDNIQGESNKQQASSNKVKIQKEIRSNRQYIKNIRIQIKIAALL